MASSISPSKVPWRALRLLAFALLAWALAAFYMVALNPELAFFLRAREIKESWAANISAQHKTKIVIYGGSSCGTSVISERFLEVHGLPVLNQGLGAAMGAKLLTVQALEKLQAGDTLVISLEPELLCVPLEYEPLGVQFSLAAARPQWLSDSQWTAWPGFLLSLRPGGYHSVTLLSKLILRRPLYRYSIAELDGSGWHQVAEKREFLTYPPVNRRLSGEAKSWLMSIRDFCQTNQVRVAYSLPWEYCPPDQVAAYQQANRRFLADIAEFVPVLKEPALGVHAVREHYMDTPWHPDKAGAVLRTDALAAAITGWQLWDTAELK